MLVQVSRDGRFDVREDESLKIFNNCRGESNWTIVIKTVHYTDLWDWDDGADFRQVGTADRSNKRLKMVVETSACWSAQFLRILPVAPSGPGAFLTLTLHWMDLTPCWSS